MKRICWLALAAVLAPVSALQADVKLPHVFADNMVLQRDQVLKIWGWADPGEEVTVSVAGQTVSDRAGDDGTWQVSLKPLQVGAPIEVNVQGKNAITLKNVLVGDVWICSGQSNMEWPVARTNDAKVEIANANHPDIRLFHVKRLPKTTPQSDVELTAGWAPCTPQTIPNFTAVGYFFGRKLNEELNVPIGLINTSWGGTRIEPWTPPVGFDSVEAVKDIDQPLVEGKFNHQSPTALYNGMVNGLVPFGVKGAIWYQGESNRGEGMLYHEKMKALINGWRTVFENKNMPFLFVQLAPFTYGGSETALPEIWEAQTATLSVPNTGMAVTTDVGNLKDIHPRNKQEVGRRLALWALAKTYGKDIVYSGPLFKSMQSEGNRIRLTFDHAEGLKSCDGKPLTWFTIAGANGEFVPAKAEIDNDTVVVWSDAVSNPQNVRFGWNQTAVPNLCNGAGLPASPFRTDGPK